MKARQLIDSRSPGERRGGPRFGHPALREPFGSSGTPDERRHRNRDHDLPTTSQDTCPIQGITDEQFKLAKAHYDELVISGAAEGMKIIDMARDIQKSAKIEDYFLTSRLVRWLCSTFNDRARRSHGR